MTTTARAAHWDAAYAGGDEARLSWFDPLAAETFELAARHLAPGGAVIDVGAGASRLADRLITAGLGPVTVLDVSAAALGLLRQRLGAAAAEVTAVAADVTRWEPPPAAFALWHDRACFHFLTAAEDRAAYLRAMARAVAPGGHALLVTFAEDGPERCSGLPVVRWSPGALASAVAGAAPGCFEPVDSRRIDHRTPAGALQRMQASLFRRSPGAAP